MGWEGRRESRDRVAGVWPTVRDAAGFLVAPAHPPHIPLPRVPPSDCRGHCRPTELRHEQKRKNSVLSITRLTSTRARARTHTLSLHRRGHAAVHRVALRRGLARRVERQPGPRGHGARQQVGRRGGLQHPRRPSLPAGCVAFLWAHGALAGRARARPDRHICIFFSLPFHTFLYTAPTLNPFP